MMTLRPLLLLVLLTSSAGCATFTRQIPAGANEDVRLSLAGHTLTCAAASQQTSIILSLASSVAAGAASGVLAMAPDQNGAIIAVGLAGVSAVAGWVSLANLWTATQYTQRAGEVAAGQSTLGGCSSSTPSAPQADERSSTRTGEPPGRVRPTSPPTTLEECRAAGGQWVLFANECKLPK